MKYCLLLPIVFILGCGSTPNTQDYIRHVNKLEAAKVDTADLAFQFVHPKVDLQAYYNRDSSIQAPAILYQGGAGIAGLLAQIGTHASVVNSQRNSLVAQAQDDANKQIREKIELVSEIELAELVEAKLKSKFQLESNDTQRVNIRPVFFTNKNNDQVNLKLVAWLLKEKPKKKKDKYLYANLIEVRSGLKQETITDQEFGQLLASLLNRGLSALVNDLNGVYLSSSTNMETFIVKVNNKNKVVRGFYVEETCTDSVFRNLHSWLIVTPKATVQESSIQVEQC